MLQRTLIILLLLGFSCRVEAQEAAIPALTARVTDQTGILSAADRTELETRLADFEREKGSQVAVLIVPTTAPETIEQYGIRVVDKWKLGREGVDDGALLLIALQDRKMRIEVGYGLEGALPDITARRIIHDVIAPHFRQEDFPGGIKAGVDAIVKVISGEELPPPEVAEGDATGGALFLLVFLLLPAAAVLRRLFGLLGSAAIGGGVGFAGGLLFSGLAAAVFIGFIVFLLLLLAGLAPQGSSRGWSTGGRGYSGGWSSKSGGGFSGRGGGFGGGGASGGW